MGGVDSTEGKELGVWGPSCAWCLWGVGLSSVLCGEVGWGPSALLATGQQVSLHAALCKQGACIHQRWDQNRQETPTGVCAPKTTPHNREDVTEGPPGQADPQAVRGQLTKFSGWVWVLLSWPCLGWGTHKPVYSQFMYFDV